MKNSTFCFTACHAHPTIMNVNDTSCNRKAQTITISIGLPGLVNAIEAIKNIRTNGDGIAAAKTLQIEGGEIDIITNGGSKNSSKTAEGHENPMWGKSSQGQQQPPQMPSGQKPQDPPTAPKEDSSKNQASNPGSDNEETTTVYGPVNDGNGPLDYGKDATVTGGSIIAGGSSGMAEGFTSSKNQGSIVTTLSSVVKANTEIIICDSAGKQVLTYTSPKDLSALIFSTSNIKKGETYTIKAGTVSVKVMAE